MVSWTTKYSALDKESYKKCVCEQALKDLNNINCQQAADNDDPEPGPEPNPEPQPPSPLEELYELIMAIKDAPHYADGSISNTSWQTDEILDYVEEQLFNIEKAFVEAGYITE